MCEVKSVKSFGSFDRGTKWHGPIGPIGPRPHVGTVRQTSVFFGEKRPGPRWEGTLNPRLEVCISYTNKICIYTVYILVYILLYKYILCNIY